MARLRVYGSSSVGFGTRDAAWASAVLSDFSPVCVSLVADVQDGTNSCYVFRAVNASNHFCTYAVPDAAIPDNATVTLAEWGVIRGDDCTDSTVARPCIDSTQVSSGWIANCGYWLTDTTKSAVLSQTGATTKGQSWGFVTAVKSPAFFTTFAVSEFAIRFTFTLPAPTSVTTNAATGVGVTTATLNGSLNPNSATAQYPCSYKFQYGTTLAYGNETAPVGNQTGSSPVNASTAVTGLSASTLYHYRIVAFNSDQTVNGSDKTFMTSALDSPVLVL